MHGKAPWMRCGGGLGIGGVSVRPDMPRAVYGAISGLRRAWDKKKGGGVIPAVPRFRPLV